MWDIAKQTKMAAAVRDFYLHVLLLSSTDFDGWGSSKDQTKDKKFSLILSLIAVHNHLLH